MSTKLEHHDWTIHTRPEKKGFHWHAWVEVERAPREDEDAGHIFPLHRHWLL